MQNRAVLLALLALCATGCEPEEQATCSPAAPCPPNLQCKEGHCVEREQAIDPAAEREAEREDKRGIEGDRLRAAVAMAENALEEATVSLESAAEEEKPAARKRRKQAVAKLKAARAAVREFEEAQ